MVGGLWQFFFFLPPTTLNFSLRTPCSVDPPDISSAALLRLADFLGLALFQVLSFLALAFMALAYSGVSLSVSTLPGTSNPLLSIELHFLALNQAGAFSGLSYQQLSAVWPFFSQSGQLSYLNHLVWSASLSESSERSLFLLPPPPPLPFFLFLFSDLPDLPSPGDRS
jgi:hypothetical protein